jgi:hypothetical protein
MNKGYGSMPKQAWAHIGQFANKGMKNEKAIGFVNRSLGYVFYGM